MSTYLDASQRISLADFARELHAWADIPAGKPEGQTMSDFSGLDDRIQAAFSVYESRESRARRYKDLFEKGKRTLVDRLIALQDEIPSLKGIKVELGKNMALSGTVDFDHRFTHPLEGTLISLCGPGKTRRPLLFLTLGLSDEGTEKTRIVAHIVMYIEGTTRPEVLWTDSAAVVLGGATLIKELDNLVLGLRKNMRMALERFTKMIEKHREVIE